MKIETLAVAVGAVVAIVTATIAVDYRYALADELQRFQYDTYMYRQETAISRAQDKLDGLLSIPPNQRQEWEEREISRLLNQIDRLIREMESGI